MAFIVILIIAGRVQTNRMRTSCLRPSEPVATTRSSAPRDWHLGKMPDFVSSDNQDCVTSESLVTARSGPFRQWAHLFEGPYAQANFSGVKDRGLSGRDTLICMLQLYLPAISTARAYDTILQVRAMAQLRL